jgi:hypothetical protein
MAGYAFFLIQAVAHRGLHQIADGALFLGSRRYERAINFVFQLCSNSDFHQEKGSIPSIATWQY